MAVYLSAGVYVKEKDLSEIVPNIATTTAALVGYSPKGSTDVRLITTTKQFLAEYGDPMLGQGTPRDSYYFHYTALAFLQQGNKLYCKRVHDGNTTYGGCVIMSSTSGAANTAIASDAGVTVTDYAYDSTYPDALFYIYGKDAGDWNNNISIEVTSLDGNAYYPEDSFQIDVYYTDADSNKSLVESWVVSRKHQLDGFGQQMYLEDKINGFSSYISVVDSDAEDTVMPKETTAEITLDGGTNGIDVPSAAQIATAWDSFSNPDYVDVRILLNGGQTAAAVHTAMDTIARSRADCIAILDMPYSTTASVNAMLVWRADAGLGGSINSSYSAAYAGWLKVYDKFSGKLLELPPSGYIGAVYAYNDYAAYEWYAPAGFNRGILPIQGVTNVFEQGERDTLYDVGLNPIQQFVGSGNVVWGQKTMQKKPSALDRVNVRRLLITIEKSCAIALRYFVFEPNSDLTRFRVKAVLDEFLDLLSSRGAFQTEGGDKGYYVLCDTTNNTPAIIDRNEMHVDIFVKPSRAAEFIQLQTIITKTGASFSELISRGVFF